MLLRLFFLLPGCFCYSSIEIRERTVLRNTVATLPCAHGRGDVTWSRFINGLPVTLVAIKNGVEKMSDKRYGSLADNSLVIRNVTSFDAAMYSCNKTRVYLRVTTEPNMAAGPDAGGEPVRASSGLGPGREGVAEEDPETRPPSGLWKVAVGVVVGAAALVLLGVLTLKFCFKKRMEKTTSLEETATEVTYEEIGVGERESYFESPYYFLSVGEPASGSTTPNNNNLYSTVNKLATQGRSSEQCVYSLAQHPVKTGNESLSHEEV